MAIAGCDSDHRNTDPQLTPSENINGKSKFIFYKFDFLQIDSSNYFIFLSFSYDMYVV